MPTIFNFKLFRPGKILSGLAKQTFCYKPIGKLGDIYGNPDGGDGVLDPTTTVEGIKILLLGDTTTGVLSAAFGDTGTDKYRDADIVYGGNSGYVFELIWDDITKTYNITGPTGAAVVNILVQNYGLEMCFQVWTIAPKYSTIIQDGLVVVQDGLTIVQKT